MKIIAITGIGLAGKDTFVRACDKVMLCGITSTIDCVKLMLHGQGLYQGNFTRLGWEDEVKGPEERKMLSKIKIALVGYNNWPVTQIGKMVREFDMGGVNITFIMVREFDELITIAKKYGADTMRVHRNAIPVCETEQSFLDQIPSDYVFDHEVFNNGTEEKFKSDARKWAKNYMQKQVGLV